MLPEGNLLCRMPDFLIFVYLSLSFMYLVGTYLELGAFKSYSQGD